MNYEKKYKEALEMAKVAALNGHQNLMEGIFPELAESKDEKIRKKLIHLVKKSNEYGGYALHKWEADEMLAWLEKQEQQFSWSYEDEANLNNIIWLCNNCINGSETTWVPSQATKIKHLIETIKEKGLSQSKQDWTEEDEGMYIRTLGILGKCYMGELPTKVEEELKWFKSLR